MFGRGRRGWLRTFAGVLAAVAGVTLLVGAALTTLSVWLAYRAFSVMSATMLAELAAWGAVVAALAAVLTAFAVLVFLLTAPPVYAALTPLAPVLAWWVAACARWAEFSGAVWR